VEAEEDRIAEAISQKESPESVLGDPERQTDFLAVLMDSWAASERAESGELAPLLGEHIAPNATLAAGVTEPLRLFADDLDFAREAFEELLANQSNVSREARLVAPEWEAKMKGFVLEAPADLRDRYRYLPPELTRDKEHRVKLTTDRALVQKALERSRKDVNAWPEYELFWEQHPVAEWLNDRMAAHFRRHEAPVLLVQHGLAPGEVAFVFQGVLSNKRSQPMVAEWFAVIFTALGAERVEDLATLVARVGLSKELVNPGRDPDRTRPGELRAEAVAAARSHLSKRRDERAKRLLPALKAGQQKLKQWAQRKLSEIERREAEATRDGKKLRSDVAERLTERRREVEQQLAQQKLWLTDTMSTLDRPYLRIAAVLLGDTKKGKR
jgi:hypothetical protein